MIPTASTILPPRIYAARAEMAGDEDALNLLLVEDDYGDMLMTMQAIDAAGLPYELNRITHGDEVLPYLMNAMQDRLPDLILLDMGLPGKDGFEILEMLAGAPSLLRAVPIAIVTMYANFDYVRKTYDLPIYGYLTKPLQPKNIQRVFDRISGDMAARLSA